MATNCFTCQNRERSEWCALTDKELDLLNRAKTDRELAPGTPLFHQGDDCVGVYCIQSGTISIEKVDASGNRVVLSLAQPGETVGYRFFLAGDATYGATAVAIEPSTACFIDNATIQSLLTANPALGLQFLRKAAADLNAYDERLMINATLTMEQRFLHLLLVLIDRFTERTETAADSVHFKLPLSRRDLAAMIGVRPESMSRIIRRTEDEGIARFKGRDVVIPRVETIVQQVVPESEY